MAEHVSDATLLERFVDLREEDAFVALVHRHGPAVLSISRRFLRCEHDVEDVFQTTFLVLALKAPGIAWQDKRWHATMTLDWQIRHRPGCIGLCGLCGQCQLPAARHVGQRPQQCPATDRAIQEDPATSTGRDSCFPGLPTVYGAVARLQFHGIHPAVGRASAFAPLFSHGWPGNPR